MDAKLTLGFHAPTWTEKARQLMDGVLRYISEESYLQIRDFRFSVSHHEYDEDPPWKGKVDGVIVNAALAPGVIPWMERGGVPVVSTAGDLRGTGIVCACLDNASIARLSAEHAAQIGYRHAGYIGIEHYEASEERRDLLQTELKSRGIDLRSIELRSIPQIGYDQPEDEVPKQAVRQLLERLETPAVVFCFNDAGAALTAGLINEMGFSLPEEIGVLGVGDTDLARINDPPLSSVRVNREEIGYQATSCLHQIIQGIDLGKTVFEIPAIEVVARQSTVGIIRAPETDIDRAIEFIRQHACDGVHLHEVAEAVHVSLRTLELDFKKQTGRTMGEMIQQIRLDRVKQLLETTNLSTQRIANLVGFTHYSCLNRMTDRMIGMTPAQYRKQHRAKAARS